MDDGAAATGRRGDTQLVNEGAVGGCDRCPTFASKDRMVAGRPPVLSIRDGA